MRLFEPHNWLLELSAVPKDDLFIRSSDEHALVRIKTVHGWALAILACD
jgi:hypothetical protein